MIRDVHPGSRGQKGTGSRIRIRNTDTEPGGHLIADPTGSGSGSLIIITTVICVQLAPRVSTGEDQRYITTPTTLSKNMITNASFRYFVS
jgi:hypothetical protein